MVLCLGGRRVEGLRLENRAGRGHCWVSGSTVSEKFVIYGLCGVGACCVDIGLRSIGLLIPHSGQRAAFCVKASVAPSARFSRGPSSHTGG